MVIFSEKKKEQPQTVIRRGGNDRISNNRSKKAREQPQIATKKIRKW